MVEKAKYEKAEAYIIKFENDSAIFTAECVGNNFTGHSGSSPYQWGPYGC